MAERPVQLTPEISRAAREQLGLTLEEMAALAEISVSTLRRLEIGEAEASAYVTNQLLSVLRRRGIEI